MPRTSPASATRPRILGVGRTGHRGPLEAIEGTVRRVVFANEQSGWSVLKLSVAGRGEDVAAVGSFGGARPGESLRLTGRWEVDPAYGQQFRAESCLIVTPSTIAGIEKYLGSGLIPGIGPVMAARLVGRFGLEALEVIETDPGRLSEVDGIGPVRSERIRRAWREQKAIKQVMVFLHEHAVSPGQAVRIYRQYGDRSAAVIRDDPYRLAADIHGIGFRTADQIASRLGIPPTSPTRVNAGVLHVLGECAAEGHVFFPRDRLAERSSRLLEVDRVLVEDAIDGLTRRKTIIGEGTDCYLPTLHAAEAESARMMRLLLATPSPAVHIDPGPAIGWFERSERTHLATGQIRALELALARKVLVITGGPGTGKTTLVRGLVRILEKRGLRILLCAPTGRAAKRLSEAAGREAKTIHRLLEFDPRTLSFARHEGRPLRLDLLVVDEASMLDITLLRHLLGGIPPSGRVVFVGDVDQLPPVGPGNVLGDLIRCGAVPVARLDEIFRQARESLIVTNAHRINTGRLPEPGKAEMGPGADFFFVERNLPEKALETIESLVARRIPARFGLDPAADIQVLSPMQKGLLGTASLNARLQERLNPDGKPAGRSFRLGDRVMQLRNNYALEVFNGDIGRVEEVNGETGQVLLRFEDRIVAYDPADLDELVLAYACTVHKSQGSEFPAVVIPMHTQHYVMLQRNLLYTAVTRGRRLVVVVGTREALGIAVRNNRPCSRFTRFAERLAAPSPLPR